MDDQTFSHPAIDPADADALERYVVGGDEACQDPEVARVVAQHPALAHQLRATMLALRTRPREHSEQSLSGAQRRIQQAAILETPQVLPAAGHAPSRTAQRLSAEHTRRRTTFTQRSIVTTLLVAILAGSAGYGISHYTDASRSLGFPPEFQHAGHRYATTTTQIAHWTLDDGTRVTLAPYTTVRLVRFDDAERTITVDGEAYFEVARSSSAPFVVQSGISVTRVLGTEFLVRHVAGDRRAHIAVLEGKVSVAAQSFPRSAVTMTAGSVSDVIDSVVHVTPMDDATSDPGLRSGEFIFRDTPVPTVLAMLTRWYGYQFRCADSSLTHQSVTVGLSMRSSATALSTLEALLGVHLTVVGDTITLTQQPLTPQRGTPRSRAYDIWIPTREVGR